MTPPDRGPYHFSLEHRPRRAAAWSNAIFRFVLIASAALVTACAGDAASKKELDALRAEVRALRATNERLESRISRVEDHQAISRAAKAPRNAAPEQAWQGDEVPSLTVVKLKPKKEPAPPLPTQTAVQEPEAEELSVLLETEADAAEDAAQAVDPALADAIFDQAVSSLRTGDVSGAVLKLQSFAEENPRHPKSDNALFYSGVGLMALDDLAGAATAFERVLKEYPAGDARIDSMLKLADCRLKLNQKDDARSLYAKLISNFPGTDAASTAQQRLSNLTQ